MTKEVLNLAKESFYQPIMGKFLKRSNRNEEDFWREVGFAIQHISGNKRLQECTKESVLKAVTNLAMIGLTLNPVSKEAYLIPRWNGSKNVMECNLEPSYIGLQKIATDTGSVKHFEAKVVYQGDDMANFNINTGEGHKPYWLAGNEKDGILGVYSVATLDNGKRLVEYMGYDEVLEIRDRSESYQAYLRNLEKHQKDPKNNYKPSPPTWVSDEGEMVRKTVLKRHFKYLPKTDVRLAKAIDLDNRANGFMASHAQIGFIEQLMKNSVLDDDEKSIIQDKINDQITSMEASNIIEQLQENQLDPITHGSSASAKEIQKAIDKKMDDDNA